MKNSNGPSISKACQVASADFQCCMPQAHKSGNLIDFLIADFFFLLIESHVASYVIEALNEKYVQLQREDAEPEFHHSMFWSRISFLNFYQAV